jgi:putative transposase
MKTADLCRKHGISEASFYNWKAKYGGLEVSEAKRLRGLESENAKLKKLLADAMLDNKVLRTCLQKNGDPRCQARGCCSCTFGVRVERAAAFAIVDVEGRLDRFLNSAKPAQPPGRAVRPGQLRCGCRRVANASSNPVGIPRM